MTLHWNGAITKSVWEAGWATTNRMAELSKWQTENLYYRRTAVVSSQEVVNLERVLVEVGGFTNGPWPLGIYEQEYVIEITSGTTQCHKVLGFSKGIIPILERIRTCLRPQAQDPVNRILGQAERWRR